MTDFLKIYKLIFSEDDLDNITKRVNKVRTSVKVTLFIVAILFTIYLLLSKEQLNRINTLLGVDLTVTPADQITVHKPHKIETPPRVGSSLPNIETHNEVHQTGNNNSVDTSIHIGKD